MKNIFRILMAVAVLFTASCAKEDISTSIGSGEANVTFTVDLPELGTRAYADGTNADILYYNVFDATTDEPLPQISGSVPGSKAFTVNIPMLKGMTYDIVFWAQKEGDDYYDLIGKVLTVKFDKNKKNANDNDRDAFYAYVAGFDPTKAKSNDTQISLYRPFGQLNAATSDFEAVAANKVVLTTSTVKVNTYTQFDLENGIVLGDPVEVTFEATAMPCTTNETLPNKPGYTYLSMNYLLPGNVNAEFTFKGKRNNGNGSEVTFTGTTYTNVPLKSNYRTNILGALLTKPTEFNVTIEKDFVGEENKFVSVANVDELVAALATNNNVEVSLTKDIDLSDILVIGGAQSTISTSSTRTATTRNVVIDGKGKTLNSKATRAINISGDVNVTIKNLTINASGERAINIIQNAKNVTLENVTATAANYTVNVTGSAPGAKVAIKNSTLNGLCTVNVAGARAQVTVDGCTVNCNDNNTTAGESYAALCLNKDAVGGSIIATDTTVNVTEGSDSYKGRNGAEDGTVTIDGSTEGVAVMVAAITYPNSDYYYSFATLEEAIEFAKAGDTIQLIRNITRSEILVIEKAITLDGKDKTLTSTAGRAINVSGANGVTIKNLTIIASGERAINLIENATNVTVENVTATSANYTFNIAGSAPKAVATINNSDLTGLNTVNIAAKESVVTINGTKLTTVDNTEVEGYTTIAVNKDAAGSAVTVNGGEVVITGTHAEDSRVASIGSDGSSINFNDTDGATNDDIEGKNFAIIYGNTWYQFATLEAAIAKAVEGDVITLIRDITVTETMVIEEDQTVILDLNGKTITGTMHKDLGAVIKNNGTLTIKNGTISSTADNGGSAVQNSGTLVVEDATLNGAPNANGSWPSYTVNNTGVMTVDDSTITSVHGAVASYNEGAKLTLNNCVIDMSGIPGFTSHGMYTYNNGKIVVNGGTYENKATDQAGSGASVINGAVEVNAGKFSGRIENYYGTPVLKGGTYSVKPNAKFVAAGYKVVEINGGYSVVAE